MPSIKSASKKVFRWRYLLDKDFQLKYAFLLSGVALCVAALIGGNVYYSAKESYEILLKAGLGSQPEVLSLVKQWKTFLNSHLLILLSASVGFLTLIGIFISHKMVGPILVLKKNLRQISEGNYNVVMRLRKNDEFQDIKDHFNQMASALQKSTKEEIVALESLKTKITDLEAQHPLTSLIQKKKQMLGETF